MAQRHSEYERREADFYPTPDWATQALVVALDRLAVDGDLPPLNSWRVWEPACGDGAMVKSLDPHVASVVGTDIRASRPFDFLVDRPRLNFLSNINAIITNPPYTPKLMNAFLTQSLEYMRPVNGLIAMLMRVDVDSAITRAPYFSACPAWGRKLVFTKRIVWFERTDGIKAAPSENHAWYIWNWAWDPSRKPTIGYTAQ